MKSHPAASKSHQQSAPRPKRKPRVALDFSKPLPPFLTSDQLAELVHATRRSAERWRREGTGPAYVVARHRVLYRVEDVLAWLASSRRTSTSAPSAA